MAAFGEMPSRAWRSVRVEGALQPPARENASIFYETAGQCALCRHRVLPGERGAAYVNADRPGELSDEPAVSAARNEIAILIDFGEALLS
jgi:hypothetical protein